MTEELACEVQNFGDWEPPGERTKVSRPSDEIEVEDGDKFETGDDVEGESESAWVTVTGSGVIEYSGDESFNLGLGGGPKFSELGVRVDVDEHDVDEFCDDIGDWIHREDSNSAVLEGTLTGETDD